MNLSFAAGEENDAEEGATLTRLMAERGEKATRERSREEKKEVTGLTPQQFQKWLTMWRGPGSWCAAIRGAALSRAFGSGWVAMGGRWAIDLHRPGGSVEEVPGWLGGSHGLLASWGLLVGLEGG